MLYETPNKTILVLFPDSVEIAHLFYEPTSNKHVDILQKPLPLTTQSKFLLSISEVIQQIEVISFWQRFRRGVNWKGEKVPRLLAIYMK